MFVRFWYTNLSSISVPKISELSESYLDSIINTVHNSQAMEAN